MVLRNRRLPITVLFFWNVIHVFFFVIIFLFFLLITGVLFWRQSDSRLSYLHFSFRFLGVCNYQNKYCIYLYLNELKHKLFSLQVRFYTTDLEKKTLAYRLINILQSISGNVNVNCFAYN